MLTNIRLGASSLAPGPSRSKVSTVFALAETRLRGRRRWDAVRVCWIKSLLGVVSISIVAYGSTGLARTVRANGAGHDQTVFSAELPNVPGKTLTAIVVEYGPGSSSPAHRPAGSVFAYVLSGQIRSENSATGPVRVYRAGETFFEPPGSTHLVSANASDREPASLLAIFVADDHAQLTQPAH